MKYRMDRIQDTHQARRWGAALLVLGLMAGSAQAAPTLAQALEAAWQRTEAARLAQGEQAAAQALARSAQQWWAQPPSLGLQHRTDRLGGAAEGRQEWTLELSVPLWQAGQRTAYAQAAQADLARSEAALRRARWQLAGEVRQAAWQLAAVQAELAQANAAAEAYARLSADVARRVQAGELPRTDALAAQAEAWAARQRQTEAQAAWQAAHLPWQRLTGSTDLPASMEEAVPASATPGSDHPALQELASAADVAQRQRDKVRTSRNGTPEFTVGWQRDVSASGQAAQTSVTLGVRVPLGRDGQQQALLAQAEAAADVAQQREQLERDLLQANVATAAAAVQQAQASVQAANEQATLLRERAELMQRAFAVGELALPDLLRAQAAARDAERSAARQQAHLGLSRALWLQSLGQLP